MSQRNRSILEKYIHPKAAVLISDWIYVFDFKLKIKKSRSSKLGDYRAPLRNSNHHISINHDLNPHAFLITLVHEIAHLSCFRKHGNKIKPHGKEWKQEFRGLMQPFFIMEVFPDDVRTSLERYLHNPAASSCSDANLYRTLKKHDTPTTQRTTLEEIPVNSLFQHGKNRYFIKGKKIRSRYHCIEYRTRREYLFNPLAEVRVVNEELELKFEF